MHIHNNVYIVVPTVAYTDLFKDHLSGWMGAQLGINYAMLFISYYRLFTAVLYLAFIGIVLLLLVSVFIAQAVSSYGRVQGIAGQMANYSSARLLTQTSSMLPMWISSFICGVNSV